MLVMTTILDNDYDDDDTSVGRKNRRGVPNSQEENPRNLSGVPFDLCHWEQYVTMASVPVGDAPSVVHRVLWHAERSLGTCTGPCPCGEIGSLIALDLDLRHVPDCGSVYHVR